jgi:hypothetical protein
MLARGFSDLLQEGNGKSLQLLQVTGPFFFAIVVLSKRSPIVEISALSRCCKSRVFNYLRLAPELPFKRCKLSLRRGTRC